MTTEIKWQFFRLQKLGGASLPLLIIFVPIKLSIRFNVSQYRCIGGITCRSLLYNLYIVEDHPS
jgi:hypothetical protein